MSFPVRLKSALVRALPDPVVFWLTPYLHRRQEPELARAREFVPQERIALDIGGWLGPWTRVLSRHVPAVHTFEPQPELAAYLRRVAPQNVTVHECAVSDRAGELPLFVPSNEPGQKALASLRPQGENTSEERARVHQVRVVRLDDLNLRGVGFVKIDVEGREAEVLAGAAELINNDRPRILLEAEERHLAGSIHDLFAHLTAQDYEGWFLREGFWQPLEQFDVQRHQMEHLDHVTSVQYINNFLFIPAEDPYSPSHN